MSAPAEQPLQAHSGFGVAALNRALGTPYEGKRYVYQARAGRDQHLLLLQLMRGSLADGASVLVLTDEDPDALVLQGSAMGLDIAQPLAAGRVHIARYAASFRDLANSPARTPALLDAWSAQLNQARPQRVVFLGWPRALDQDIKLLQVLDQLAVAAVRQTRAACFHFIDPDDCDRYGRDVRRSAFAEVWVEPAGSLSRCEIVRGPVAADLGSFDLVVRQGVGFADADPPSGPVEASLTRVDRVRTLQ